MGAPEKKGDKKDSEDTEPEGLLPTAEEVPFANETFDASFWQDDSCKLMTFNETFYFTRATVSDTNGSGVIGERYFFDHDLNRTDGTQVPDVKLTGMCTRTRKAGESGTAGAGTCNWVVYHESGNWSMSLSGMLESAAVKGYGGAMAVTGGTGEMVSIMGEMDVWPIDINGMLAIGDIFNSPGVYAYYVTAIYGILICPQPYHMSPAPNATTGTTVMESSSLPPVRF
jgi:hypothetical protein